MMYSEKLLKSLCPPVFGFYFLKVSRLGVANQESYTVTSNRFHGPEIWKSWIFPKYWRWWGVQASKFMKFVRWRDFNALRRAHVSFQVTCRVVTPKSNIVYRGDCSTKCGRTIRAVSNFDLHFRDHKWCILKNFWNRRVRRCLNFTFWKYHGWALRIKKVIRNQATGSMDRKFRNHEIFQNIDAGERFRPLKSRNSLAGAISMPCGAPTYHFKWLVEWLHRRVISSTGAIVRRKAVV